jgi:DNA-binding transcriptional ArsR family regulator
MKKPSETEDTDPRILDRLRAYTALDNPIRLRAFRLIHDSPGLPFHEIAKAVRIESGLLAYHMGVLKAAALVDVAYERDGRQVTSYRLGARGDELFSELFGNPSNRSSSRRAGVLQRVAARQH